MGNRNLPGGREAGRGPCCTSLIIVITTTPSTIVTTSTSSAAAATTEKALLYSLLLCCSFNGHRRNFVEWKNGEKSVCCWVANGRIGGRRGIKEGHRREKKFKNRRTEALALKLW
ncbi:hypothetical protein niasHS_006518 [Heterodera schachtii]|uniref:Uncharacterized protein n=1 Tax=Heterodera schachtii TaxID=97005 RepID=A0ABD2JHG2_HETSC